MSAEQLVQRRMQEQGVNRRIHGVKDPPQPGDKQHEPLVTRSAMMLLHGAKVTQLLAGLSRGFQRFRRAPRQISIAVAASFALADNPGILR